MEIYTKNKRLWLWLLAMVMMVGSQAQTSQVTVRKGITYCTAQFPGQDKMEKLCFDFYEPEGRGDTLRPLVITVFGGGFVLGSRSYEDMAAWCNRLAKDGYAAASIDYRLMPATKSSYKGLVRAGYMAAQDVSAAVRFFKANSGKYGIDTNRIYLLGQSAGAVAIIHALYMDEDERPKMTLEPPVLPPLHSQGDAETMAQPFSVAGAVLLWGCIFDPEMIDPDETTPVCFIHGGKDKILPADSGYAFSLSRLPYVYGSQVMAERLQKLGSCPFELHILDEEPHAFYFKYLYVYQLDKLKFDKCYQLATKFMKKH